VQRHCGKVLFVGFLVLSLCAVGLKTADIEEDLEKLWVEGKQDILNLTENIIIMNISFSVQFS
jgi:hypothetical protein